MVRFLSLSDAFQMLSLSADAEPESKLERDEEQVESMKSMKLDIHPTARE